MTDRHGVVIEAPSSRPAERRYVLDVILRDWLGIDFELIHASRADVSIRLASDPDGMALLVPDGLLGIDPDGWLTSDSLPSRPLEWVDRNTIGGPTTGARFVHHGRGDPDPIPALFVGSAAFPHAARSLDGGLALTFDLFGAIFFFLTRYEEVVTGTRDSYDRFPATESLAVREGLLGRAIVDEYVDVLWSALRSLWPRLTRRPTTFELLLTHDVDQPWSTWRQPLARLVRATGADLLVRRRPDLAWGRLRGASARDGRRLRHDPFDTFDTLMEASERLGSPATFFLLAGNEPGEPDFRYRITDAPVGRLLRRVHARGHEIGLHGSLESFRSGERIAHELDALRTACETLGIGQDRWGVRQHFLRFANPDTWRAQELAGLDYDSTIGFAEMPGFRAGTCREYLIFDLLSSRTLRLRERPLCVMDVALFHYMRLSSEQAWTAMRQIVRTCRRHEGTAVVLIHNNSLPVYGLDRGFHERITDLASAR